MELSVKVEDKLHNVLGRRGGSSVQFSSSSSSTYSGSNPIAKPLEDIRRLSEKELRSKREKEKVFIAMRSGLLGICVKKELSVILMQGEGCVDDSIALSEEDLAVC